jgi:ubiquinone/menaquinone biosynthesis C-methylase UbiE
VLDVGCGEGTFTFQLAKLNKVKKVIGIDISSKAISYARHKYSEIDFEVMSAEKLIFADRKFNMITVIEIIEHVLDTEKMLKEFNRVLKMNGKLFITTTDFNLLKKAMIAIFFWDKYFYPTNPHIRFFTKSTLEDILNRTGFKIISYRWNESYFGIMPKGQIVIAEKTSEK